MAVGVPALRGSLPGDAPPCVEHVKDFGEVESLSGPGHDLLPLAVELSGILRSKRIPDPRGGGVDERWAGRL